MPFNSSEYAKAPSLFFNDLYNLLQTNLSAAVHSYLIYKCIQFIFLAEIATDEKAYTHSGPRIKEKIIDAQIIRQEQIHVNTSPRASSCR